MGTSWRAEQLSKGSTRHPRRTMMPPPLSARSRPWQTTAGRASPQEQIRARTTAGAVNPKTFTGPTARIEAEQARPLPRRPWAIVAGIHGYSSARASPPPMADFRRSLNWLESIPCGRCGCPGNCPAAYAEREAELLAGAQATGRRGTGHARIMRNPAAGHPSWPAARRVTCTTTAAACGAPGTSGTAAESRAPRHGLAVERRRAQRRARTARTPRRHSRCAGRRTCRRLRFGDGLWDSEVTEQPGSAREPHSRGTPRGGMWPPAATCRGGP